MAERAATGSPTGVVVVDKGTGWTSHDVVDRCRRIFGLRRVGHAGTLDPDATGVLVVGLGKATRVLRFVTALEKSYVGDLVLGVETSTLDGSGEVVRTWDMSGATLEKVREVASGLTGEILQVPPMVSAVRIGGRRLHELARRGVAVERRARPVTVRRLDILAGPTPGVMRMFVDCSSGTYVRSLASSIGEGLGGGAHVRNLRRRAVGTLSESEAVPIESLSPSSLLPPAEAVRDYPRLVADYALAQQVRNGAKLDRRALGARDEGPWAVLDPAGELLAMYEDSGQGRMRPAAVVSP